MKPISRSENVIENLLFCSAVQSHRQFIRSLLGHSFTSKSASVVGSLGPYDFRSLEAADRGSDSQLQVTENVN